jgi:hypothetical protein
VAWRGEAIGNRAPNQALGYDRDARHLGFLGEGGMGQDTAGTSQLARGLGGVTVAGQAWHPTILYLFGLLLAEMVVFGIISNFLK